MNAAGRYFRKMSGGGHPPASPAAETIVGAGLGGAAAIAAVGGMTHLTSAAMLMAPFGASCFLAFAVPESPLAQPRNIVGGHVLSAAVGIAALAALGDGWIAMSVAVGAAIALMQMTRTGHAPAAANPLVVMPLAPDWSFLMSPVLLGAVGIAAVALLYNNLRPGVRYPIYW